MFIGAINGDLRMVLAKMAPAWQGHPVYVGCSGNFTVERVLAQAGVRDLHSNDVSLYSCAIGAHLSGQAFPVTVQDPEYAWLTEYLTPGVPTIATLLLCSEYFQHSGRPEPFHLRIAAAIEKRWKQMHADTVQRVTRALEGLKIKSFFPGDVLTYAEETPQDCVFVAFPPTYRLGYERLYKVMDRVFKWDNPSYVVFDEARLALLSTTMQEKAAWVTLVDREDEALMPYCVARLHTSLRNKPVYVYAGEGKRTITTPRQKVTPIALPRLEGEIQPPLGLVKLAGSQLNLLRSEYLSPAIAPSAPQLAIGVTCGGCLIGAMGFNRTEFGDWRDVYLLSDFSIRPTPYPRLSKLVLVAALSTEMKTILEQAFNGVVLHLLTTAFTDKPMSMKYRGLFDVQSRKEHHVNYVAATGRWTLQEGFAWWMKHHSKVRTSTE